MKRSLVDDYRECVEICKRIDYGNSPSVRANNRAATKMRKLVENAAKDGSKALEPLFELLTESVASEWLSFQLLEMVDPLPPEIASKCLEIIRGIACDPKRYATSLGAQVWLENWEQMKKRRN